METEAARSQLERLKRALGEFGGIEWTPIPLDSADPAAAVAAALTAAAPVSESGRLRTLAAAILEHEPWCSLPVIRVYPESARERLVLRADLVVFDPAATLTSVAARTALADGAPHPDEVARQIWQALAAQITAGGFVLVERQHRIQAALSAANMAFGGDRTETLASALEGLGGDAAAMVGDMVLLTRRETAHSRMREDLETLLENDVRAPGGGLRGKRMSRGTWAKPPRRLTGSPEWRDDPSLGGSGELPDLAPLVSNAAGNAEVIARLGAVVEDEQATEGTRLDALRSLAAIDDPEARAWRLRALGYSTIFLNALLYAPLADAQPLFREIVLSRDDRRIAGAFALLRRYGRDGMDAGAVWEAAIGYAVPEVEVRLAPSHRSSLVEHYAELGDASVAAAPAATVELLDSLEDTMAMTAMAARLPELSLGTTRPAAGLKHAHPITGLAVNALAEPVVASADAGGFVQITLVEFRATGRALTPVHRDLVHGPGRTVVSWASDRRIVSAGGDRKVKEIDATDARAPRVVKEHAMDVPVTAMAPLGFLTMGLGDAAGRVFGFEADGTDSPRLIAQLRLGEIRRLLAWPREENGFVAIDVEGRVAVVDANGPRTLDLSVPVRPETVAFVPSGMLLGYGGGNAIFVDAKTGQVADSHPPEEEEPLVIRFDGSDDLAAFESGSVHVTSEPGVRYAGSEPLARVEASWKQGVVVMATRAGWLRYTEFRR